MDQKVEAAPARGFSRLDCDQTVLAVAAILANAVPDAFGEVARPPEPEISFNFETDFSEAEQRRFLELAALVLRRLDQSGVG